MEEELEEDRASVDAAELRARRGCGDRWRGGTWGAAAATELAMAMGGEALPPAFAGGAWHRQGFVHLPPLILRSSPAQSTPSPCGEAMAVRNMLARQCVAEDA